MENTKSFVGKGRKSSVPTQKSNVNVNANSSSTKSILRPKDKGRFIGFEAKQRALTMDNCNAFISSVITSVNSKNESYLQITMYPTDLGENAKVGVKQNYFFGQISDIQENVQKLGYFIHHSDLDNKETLLDEWNDTFDQINDAFFDIAESKRYMFADYNSGYMFDFDKDYIEKYNLETVNPDDVDGELILNQLNVAKSNISATFKAYWNDKTTQQMLNDLVKQGAEELNINVDRIVLNFDRTDVLNDADELIGYDYTPTIMVLDVLDVIVQDFTAILETLVNQEYFIETKKDDKGFSSIKSISTPE